MLLTSCSLSTINLFLIIKYSYYIPNNFFNTIFFSLKTSFNKSFKDLNLLKYSTQKETWFCWGNSFQAKSLFLSIIPWFSFAQKMNFHSLRGVRRGRRRTTRVILHQRQPYQLIPPCRDMEQKQSTFLLTYMKARGDF